MSDQIRVEVVPSGAAAWRKDRARAFQCQSCMRPVFSTIEDPDVLPNIECGQPERGFHRLTWKERRLTDEQLRTIESVPDAMGGTLVGVPIRILVDEIRRLRSDEWMRAALREIREGNGPPPISIEAILAVFRKHRDGKA